jgi:hypothetical protein
MTQTKRSGRKSAAKKLLMSSLILLSLGAGSSQAQTLSQFTPIGSFEGHDYYLTSVANWDACEQMAVAVGGHLANVGSVGENNFLTQSVPSTTLAWIGLYKNGQNQWLWSDGVTNNYSIWGTIQGTQQPDNHEGVQGAALIHSGAGDPTNLQNAVNPASAWDDGDPIKVEINGIVELTSCTSSATISVDAPSIALGFGTQIGKVTVKGLPAGATYTWTVKRQNTVVSTSNSTTGTFTFDPLNVAGLYTVYVVVSNVPGCTPLLTQQILVSEIREFDNNGKATGKVLICHTESNTPMTKSVAAPAVQAHLNHGDYLGACVGNSKKREVMAATEVQVYPNPTQNAFFVNVPQTEEVATVTLLDIQGKVIDSRKVNANDSRKVRFDLENNARGLYVIEVAYGETRFRGKIVRQ